MSAARKSAPTQAQKDAAATRRKKMMGLWRDVAKMSAEQKAEMFRTRPVITPEGRGLSCFNTCFILTQMEGATVVGGFQQWKRMGRMVRKGEKGLAIWFPRMRAAADDGGERRLVAGVSDGEDDDGEKMEMKFMLGTVFDISQTEEVEAERGSK